MWDEEEVWPEETAASAPAALGRARHPQLQEDGPWEQPPIQSRAGHAETGIEPIGDEPSTLELKRIAITERAAAAKINKSRVTIAQTWQKMHAESRETRHKKHILKSEVNLAVQRMNDASWSGVVTEYVEGWRALGFKRIIVALPVIQLCGQPLEWYVGQDDPRVDYAHKPAWLGRDGHLYALNAYFWLRPDMELAPLAQANTTNGPHLGPTDELLMALRGLR